MWTSYAQDLYRKSSPTTTGAAAAATAQVPAEDSECNDYGHSNNEQAVPSSLERFETSSSSSKEAGGGGGGAESDIIKTVPRSKPRAASSNANANSNANTNNDKEATLVKGARLTVILVLVVSAALVAIVSYVLLSNNEKATFAAQFAANARQVIHLASKNAKNVLTSIETLATLYPFYIQSATSNQSFPYVTIPGFEALGSGIRDVSKASAVAYVPLLNNYDALIAWNQYSSQHAQAWFDDGRKHTRETERLAFVERQRAANKSTEVSNAYFPVVFNLDSVTGEPIPAGGENEPVDFWAPIYQMTPVPPEPTAVNYNMATGVLGAALAYSNATQRPVLTEPINGRRFFPVDVDGPLSGLIHPVFDTLASNDKNNTRPRVVVGYVAALLAWKYFFDNVLPDGQNGIVVVVQSCNVYSTFEINGVTATFLGDGDLHDRRYDDMEATLVDLIPSESTATDQDNDSQQEQQSCHHSLHIYPTTTLEQVYLTQTPLLYSMLSVSMFAFAIFIFLTYDWFVTNRQSRTERRADTSNAIVQELFPGAICSQLYENHEQQQQQQNQQQQFRTSASGTATTTAHSTDPHDIMDDSEFGAEAIMESGTTAIADLYPEATVLFADIAGFTAWSATRDPSMVFMLLESVFGAFDKIAKRLGVFKVETIGDCYVAVCGVPKADAEHAVVMTRFAMAMNFKFRAVCQKLEPKLGADTVDLALRIGLHSGPVTAGVVRGERARFQLFGDTVNTASRMESTGQRDRIHVSEQTAAELVQHGKDDWLVRRLDTIEAKGKGRLVTYWIKPNSDVGSNHGGSGNGSGPNSTYPDSDDGSNDGFPLDLLPQHGNGNGSCNGGFALSSRPSLGERNQSVRLCL